MADRVWVVGNIVNNRIEPIDVYLDNSFDMEFLRGIEKIAIHSDGYDKRDSKKACWKTADDRKPRFVRACNMKINDDLFIPRELIEGNLPPAIPLSEMPGEII